jgi:hypothetical protein
MIRVLLRTAVENSASVRSTVTIAQAISSGQGLAVRDGSFKDTRSTSVFLLEVPTGAAGRTFVPGQLMDQDSYRGKFGGIMGVLHTARCVATIYGVTSGLLRIGLDGEEAMEQATLIGPVPAMD